MSTDKIEPLMDETIERGFKEAIAPHVGKPITPGLISLIADDAYKALEPAFRKLITEAVTVYLGEEAVPPLEDLFGPPE